jgi:hypothetical protein
MRSVLGLAMCINVFRTAITSCELLFMPIFGARRNSEVRRFLAPGLAQGLSLPLRALPETRSLFSVNYKSSLVVGRAPWQEKILPGVSISFKIY